MPGLLIKQMPPKLHKLLKEAAERDHRSMTAEALAILERDLCERTLTPLPDIKPFRGGVPLTDDILAHKRDGLA